MWSKEYSLGWKKMKMLARSVHPHDLPRNGRAGQFLPPQDRPRLHLPQQQSNKPEQSTKSDEKNNILNFFNPLHFCF
jgi:hypothetical protein